MNDKELYSIVINKKLYSRKWCGSNVVSPNRIVLLKYSTSGIMREIGFERMIWRGLGWNNNGPLKANLNLPLQIYCIWNQSEK